MSKLSPEADALDRAIIVATQGGLPLVSRPYAVIAEQVGTTSEEVRRRMDAMLESGVIRRIGVVPNHYAIGYRANGMTVWDISDDMVEELGQKVGALEFVTHCYCRPRHPPVWNYNLFAMVHGPDRAEVERKMETIRSLLGAHVRGHDVLYSTRILKKTGLRLPG